MILSEQHVRCIYVHFVYVQTHIQVTCLYTLDPMLLLDEVIIS